MEKQLIRTDNFTTDTRQLDELYSKTVNLITGLQATRLGCLKEGMEDKYNELDEKNDLAKESLAAAEGLVRLAYRLLQQAQTDINHDSWERKWDGKRATARQVHELIWGNANITNNFV